MFIIGSMESGRMGGQRLKKTISSCTIKLYKKRLYLEDELPSSVLKTITSIR